MNFEKLAEKIDQMLCENIVDVFNADIDWENIEGETGLKQTVLNLSDENQRILDFLRKNLTNDVGNFLKDFIDYEFGNGNLYREIENFKERAEELL